MVRSPSGRPAHGSLPLALSRGLLSEQPAGAGSSPAEGSSPSAPWKKPR